MRGMNEKTVTVELPASDWHSVLSILQVVLEREKVRDDADRNADVCDILTLLYEEIDRQLAEGDGKGHAHGLYSMGEDT